MQYLTFIIAILSGIAGLGYQITWSRMFAVGLGHEMPSVLAVITAFFAGLAIGGWWLDQRIAQSRRPAIWYVGIELTIAIWVLVTIFLIPLANQLCFHWMGESPTAVQHWLIAFLVPLITLLPATVAMGATLPAMDRFLAPQVSHRKVVGGLYAANTFGAVLGTLLSAYWINPQLGYTKSLVCFAGLNLLCALTIGLCLRRQILDKTSTLEPENGAVNGKDLAAPNLLKGQQTLFWIGVIAFLTGLLGIGFEVVGIRALSNVFANTVYSYAAILSVFLVGTAIGGAIYQRFLCGLNPATAMTLLLEGLMIGLVIGAMILANSRMVYRLLREQLENPALAELMVAGLVFGLPTVMMGMIFSHLAQSARHAHGGVGSVLAVNTIGSALAPIIFGIVLIPAIGVHLSLVGIAVGYGLLYIGLVWLEVRRSAVGLALNFLAVLAIFWMAVPEAVEIKPGQRLIVEKPGLMTSVAVVANADEKRGLRVSNHFVMGGTAHPEFERIQGLLSILHHPRPSKALFLGVGTGITMGAATSDPRIMVTGVELVPEIIELLRYFEPENLAPGKHPRVRLVAADARRFIRASRRHFDVVLGDLYHPGRDGAGSLYTVEHFSAIRDLLTEEGIACIWVPSYQTDTQVFKMIIRSYLEVFPNGVAYCGLFDDKLLAIALISEHPFAESPSDWYGRRSISEMMEKGLAAVHLKDSVALMGHLVADNTTLRSYAGEGQLNRDDLPAVTYLAPQYVYRRYPDPNERFRDLSAAFASRRQEWLVKFPQPKADRIRRYWEARDYYFQALELSHSDRAEAILLSLKASNEFPDAYREALRIAQSLNAERLPRQAITWLKKVVAIQPEVQAANNMLRRLEQELAQ
jgi:spermidine synthase